MASNVRISVRARNPLFVCVDFHDQIQRRGTDFTVYPKTGYTPVNFSLIPGQRTESPEPEASLVRTVNNLRSTGPDSPLLAVVLPALFQLRDGTAIELVEVSVHCLVIKRVPGVSVSTADIKKCVVGALNNAGYGVTDVDQSARLLPRWLTERRFWEAIRRALRIR